MNAVNDDIGGFTKILETKVFFRMGRFSLLEYLTYWPIDFLLIR
jgi:hypothetical protein